MPAVGSDKTGGSSALFREGMRILAEIPCKDIEILKSRQKRLLTKRHFHQVTTLPSSDELATARAADNLEMWRPTASDLQLAKAEYEARHLKATEY